MFKNSLKPLNNGADEQNVHAFKNAFFFLRELEVHKLTPNSNLEKQGTCSPEPVSSSCPV
jgi:hypothetical protein